MIDDVLAEFTDRGPLRIRDLDHPQNVSLGADGLQRHDGRPLPQLLREVRRGQTAFDFNTGFQIGGVVSTTPELGDQIEAAPLPRLNDGDPIYGAESGYQPLVVWKDSEVQEESKAFLETLYADEDYIEFLHAVPVGMMPVLRDIAENPAFLDDEAIQQRTCRRYCVWVRAPLPQGQSR